MTRLDFRHFLEQNTVGTHNDYATASYLNSDQTGSDQNIPNYSKSPSIPSLDMILPNELPFIKKKGVIIHVEMNKNPIRISLSDGTELFLSYDQFRRLLTKPVKGKTIEVTFLRNPNDGSAEPSKIEKIIVS